MQDIKPDTSKYPKLTDKLRAIALIFDSYESFQVRGSNPNEMWNENHIVTELSHMCEQVLSGGEIRIKPKPRELWGIEINGQIACNLSGQPITSLGRPSNLPSTHAVVRFVEQP